MNDVIFFIQILLRQTIQVHKFGPARFKPMTSWIMNRIFHASEMLYVGSGFSVMQCFKIQFQLIAMISILVLAGNNVFYSGVRGLYLEQVFTYAMYGFSGLYLE